MYIRIRISVHPIYQLILIIDDFPNNKIFMKKMNIQVGFWELWTVACGDLLSVQSSPLTTYSNPSFSQDRLVNNAKNLLEQKRRRKIGCIWKWVQKNKIHRRSRILFIAPSNAISGWILTGFPLWSKAISVPNKGLPVNNFAITSQLSDKAS